MPSGAWETNAVCLMDLNCSRSTLMAFAFSSPVASFSVPDLQLNPDPDVLQLEGDIRRGVLEVERKLLVLGDPVVLDVEVRGAAELVT